MIKVGLFEAKTHFSQLVDDLIVGKNDCVYVLRRGKPAVQITLAPPATSGIKIGAMKHAVSLPADFDEKFDALDAKVAELFLERGK